MLKFSRASFFLQKILYFFFFFFYKLSVNNFTISRVDFSLDLLLSDMRFFEESIDYYILIERLFYIRWSSLRGKYRRYGITCWEMYFCDKWKKLDLIKRRTKFFFILEQLEFLLGKFWIFFSIFFFENSIFLYSIDDIIKRKI